MTLARLIRKNPSICAVCGNSYKVPHEGAIQNTLLKTSANRATAQEATKLSAEAAAVLARLRQGPVGLGDVLDLTTSSGDLGGWCRELRQAGLPVVREANPNGAWVRWRLASSADADPAA